MHLEIIEENADYIIINKPAGLIVEHNPFEFPSVEDLVETHLRQKKRKPFVGIVHRLDKVTSGVLVFAKKKSILKLINQQFAEKRVRKTYLAIVSKPPQKEQEQLSHFLIKDQKNKRAIIHNEERPKSQQVILTYQLIDQKETNYLLEIKPLTGKFHQIRAQLAHIGLPILGDEKYGNKTPYFPKAIALHASMLSFQNPTDGNKETFKAKLPENKFWNDLQY